MSDPDIFEKNRKPTNLVNQYSPSMQELLNGKQHTFGRYEPYLHGDGYIVWASPQLAFWDHQANRWMKRKFKEHPVTAIYVVPGNSVFKNIFGGKKKIPAILYSMWGKRPFIFPVIKNLQRTVNLKDGSDRAYAIKRIAFNENANLLVEFQIERYTIFGYHDNNATYVGWDAASLREVDDNGHTLQRYLLSDRWKFRLVNYIIDNHYKPLKLESITN